MDNRSCCAVGNHHVTEPVNIHVDSVRDGALVDTLLGETDSDVEFEVTGPTYGLQSLTFKLSSENAGADMQAVDVSGRLPSVTVESSPRDLDGDGLFEDVDGDGAFTIFDVQALFKRLSEAE